MKITFTIYLSIVNLITNDILHLDSGHITMKNIAALFVATALTTLSFASVAAVEVQSAPAGQQEVAAIGVSASSDLSSVESKLAQKADAMGAKSFKITSVTGSDNLHGTAVLYK
jgi:multiple stress resistance protein BhsA